MRLAADFPPVSEAEWRERAEASLKGRPLASLVTETVDGLRVEPIYRRAADAPATDAPGRAPVLAQRVDRADSDAANAQALDDLKNGASGLALVQRGAVTAGAEGLDLDSVESLRRCLDGVEVDLIALRLDPGDGGRETAAMLLDLYAERGLDHSRCDLTLGLDPLSAMARRGVLEEEPAVAEAMADVARLAIEKGFSGQAFLADTRAWHDAGATEAQELGLALADAVAMLRWLERGGLRLEAATGLVGFLLATDADQFLSIAKLRALRLLWSRAREAMEVQPALAALHVETSWRMLSRLDPHVNLLRTATAAFAAIVGGADSLTVLPFTAASGAADGFARRMARNIQTILVEESGLARVADPGAGSGYVEHLTGELARKAWGEFQEIERRGGLYAALASGFVQSRIAEAAGRRAALVARRNLPLTGVSEFPNPDDRSSLPSPLVGEGGAKRRIRGPSPSPAGLRPAPSPARGEGIVPLPQARLAEPFERLRDAADAAPLRPAVFLANLGRLSDFNARATWVENLLAAGGIAAVPGPGGRNVDEIGEAFRMSGLAVACLCSSDATYAELGADAARALKAAGARDVLLAGRPRELEESLKAAGVSHILFAGQDVIEALRRLHGLLGVAEPGAAA